MVHRVQAGDRTVAEDTETHPHVCLRVMSGRPHQGIAIVNALIQQRINQFDHAARSQQGDVVRAHAHGRTNTRLAAGLVQDFHTIQMIRLVQHQYFRFGCGPGSNRHQLFRQAGYIQQILESPFGLGMFRVLVRLYL